MKTLVMLRNIGAVLLLVVKTQTSWAQSSDALRLQAFYQGETGNCASVALIKAAIDRYGLGKVFDTIRVGPIVKIKLRNGKVLTLTNAERTQAAEAAEFVRSDMSQSGDNHSNLPTREATLIIRYANFCYAVMAKYLETFGKYGCINDDCKTASPKSVANFRVALAKLAAGVCSDNIYRYLGLDVRNPCHVDFEPSMDFTKTRGVIVYSDDHAVMLWRKYFDYQGDWVRRSKHGQCKTNDFTASYYLVLK